MGGARWARKGPFVSAGKKLAAFSKNPLTDKALRCIVRGYRGKRENDV